MRIRWGANGMRCGTDEHTRLGRCLFSLIIPSIDDHSECPDKSFFKQDTSKESIREKYVGEKTQMITDQQMNTIKRTEEDLKACFYRDELNSSLTSIDCVTISDLSEEIPNSYDVLLRHRKIRSNVTDSTIENTTQSCSVEENYPDYLIKREYIIREVTQEMFFNEYVLGNKPCIIKKLCNEWPSIKYGKWTIQMLLRTLGNSNYLYNNSFSLLHKDGEKLSRKKNKKQNNNFSRNKNRNRSTDIKNDSIMNKLDCYNCSNIPRGESNPTEGNVVTLFDYLKKIKNWENEILKRQNKNRNKNQNKDHDENKEENKIKNESGYQDGNENESVNGHKNENKNENENENKNQGITDKKIIFDKFSPNIPYIFDSTLSFGSLNKLLTDYTVPSIFCKEKKDILSFISDFGKINFRWFLLGSRYSGLFFHS